MSLDPDERLAALRREVLAEEPAPAVRVPPPDMPASISTEAVAGLTPAATSATEPAATPAPERAATPATEPAEDTSSDDRWDLRVSLADTRLSTWLGLGLLSLGGYLVLSWFVPGIDLIGSLLLLAAGVVLLAQHLQRGAGAWALYAGMLLIGLGAGRAIGDLLPGSPHGLTAMGVGCAFLAIGYVRHTQAGGYGWQGIVGGAVLGLGVIQFVLGLLPGSPGVFDLILPAILLVGGGWLITRSLGRVGDL